MKKRIVFPILVLAILLSACQQPEVQVTGIISATKELEVFPEGIYGLTATLKIDGEAVDTLRLVSNVIQNNFTEADTPGVRNFQPGDQLFLTCQVKMPWHLLSYRVVNYTCKTVSLED